ncbi:U-box domain-containing protein 35 [Nymphaea thermarum]|nr:U-box domain-containing protein 35 [Nymphaea thermarum]
MMQQQHGEQSNEEWEDGSLPKMAVAIDRDKGSQFAVKWAVDKLLIGVPNILLVHVRNKAAHVQSGFSISDGCQASIQEQLEIEKTHLFLPFRGFCARKHVNVKEVVLEDVDVARALIDFITANSITSIVLGASSRNALSRKFRQLDVPGSVSRGAPEFCTVYVIAKGKTPHVRPSTRPAPPVPQKQAPVARPQPPLPASLKPAIGSPHQSHEASDQVPTNGMMRSALTRGCKPSLPAIPGGPGASFDKMAAMGGKGTIQSPHEERRGSPRYGESTDVFCRAIPNLPLSTDGFPSDFTYISNGNDFPSSHGTRSMDFGSDGFEMPSSLDDNPEKSANSTREMEAEMKRLRLELKQTMEMYSNACKEALTAKQKAKELHQWQIEDARKLEEARLAGEAALAIAEMEKAKSKAAIEAAEAARRIAEIEAQKRMNAEMKAKKEAEEKKKVLDALANSEVRYRKYNIQEIETATEFFSESLKIGEGGYGPVYKATLDHTAVAIKVLRPDAAQGRMQFQQEVEVLSCIRHPNMVLLLGACPEYGCLVYEFMERGSLDDRLFRRGNTPSLPWQLRFKIAAEIATGLLFLHQTKPEPLVHRDLKPANILLDRNYVSKISDVGLARLVPPSVADTVTQYRMTSTAGTFCYIDPEYQQTGMLGIKSDMYSLGIMLLQIITAKPPMGLTHHVERSIERGTFKEMLDPTVPDWPVEEALIFAKLSLKCAELRRKDRPDLATVVLPELNRLKDLGNSSIGFTPGLYMGPHSHVSEEMPKVRTLCKCGGHKETTPMGQGHVILKTVAKGGVSSFG